MKRVVCAVILALLVTVPVLAQNRVTVFRDLAWGDPPEVLGEATITKDRGRFREYARKNEDLQLGPVKALMIRYGFFDNKLFRITVGARDDQPLDDLLVARYGKPLFDLVFTKAWAIPDQDTLVAYGLEGGFKVMLITSESIQHMYSKWEKEQKAAEAQSAW